MDLKTTLLILLGLAFAAQASQFCLGLVPGTEPERVIEAGMLALRLVEGQKVTLVVGTDPLLNLPQADPADLYEVLKPFSPRPTRGRLVPTLKACITHAAASVLLITAEGQTASLLPLLTELGRKRMKLSIVALAPEAEPLAEVARATGGTFHLSRESHSMALGILEAISHIRGHLCRGPETWILDAVNPIPLKIQGVLFLISDGPLHVFLVTPEGHKVYGELLHRGRVFLYRFFLPGREAHLISSSHAVWIEDSLLPDEPVLELKSGVGGIAPLLFAEAIRTIGEQNPEFGQNLEVNLIWVEPWPEETDPRILGNARAEEKKVETISSLEKILRPLLDGMEINDAVALLDSFSQRFRAFKEEVHSWLIEPADEPLRRALMRLERARMSPWLGRTSRCRRAIRTLAEAATDHILRKEQELRHRYLLQLYTDLEEHFKTKENKLLYFRQAFNRAITRAKEVVSGPPPYKTIGRLEVIEPLLEKRDYYRLLQEFLRCDPEKPGRDLIVALAKELQPFDYCDNDPEGLYEKLGEFFGERLKEFGELDIPKYVRLKAKADHRGEEEVWAEILERLGTGGAWWTVDHAKLPSQKPISSLTILATPTNDLPVSSDRMDVRVLGDPQRLVLLNVELGAHKQALRAWRWLWMVPEPADGKGPIRPPSLNPDHS